MPQGWGGSQNMSCWADGTLCLSSYEHIQEEPVPVGTCYGPVPAVPRSYWGSEPVPMAMARGWGGARRSLAHPAPSVTHVAFKFPSMEVEGQKKAKENIPVPDDVPCGAIGGEAVPAQAQEASGRFLGMSEAEDTVVVGHGGAS